MMRLTVLGMNGPFPAADSACSGYLVEAGSTLLQLDLGCGTLPALTRLAAPESLSALLLSHWHFDHASDVLPLIYRMESCVARGGAPLKVYGPVDEASPIRAAVARTPGMELHDLVPGETIQFGGVTVRIFPARHPVPAVMLRVEDGRAVLCYTGDTNTQDALLPFAKGADLLLADGLFPQSVWGEKKPHLAAAQCARLALDAGAKRLIITHLNPDIDPSGLLEEARTVFPEAVLAERGMRVTL